MFFVVIKAKTKEDQEKFGKLRISQPVIKSSLIDINNGIELLEAMGFSKKQMKTKDGKMDDYMVYDFSIPMRTYVIIYIFIFLIE